MKSEPVDPAIIRFLASTAASVSSAIWAPRPTSLSAFSSSSPVTSEVLKENLFRFCIENDLWIRRTGSQLVKDITPNDYDYVVEDTEGILEPWLIERGYFEGGSRREDSTFTSYKADNINVIVVHNREQFQKWLMATEMLKRVQPKDKKDRIEIFDVIFGKTEVPF